MCGIAGFYQPSGFSDVEAEPIATRMRDHLVHRGPDDAGVWLEGSAGIALAHRRLSILDLSSAGHQPMISASGRFVLVFNGEIYNHQSIRRKLEHSKIRAWRGNSDTESLLVAIEVWGIEHSLKETVGMFALALWDRKERCLTLARDRMGEKPLYYGWQSGTLLFGSELKALHEHPDFCSEIDRDVFPIYLRHGYIPAPWCVWNGIRKLLPGTFVRFKMVQPGVMPEPEPYWSFSKVIAQGQAAPFVGSDEEAADLLEAQISKSISGQRVADVPLGAFLSGGIDSSTVVALMQAQSSRPVKTFTIGFAETESNEADYAKAVAAHLGTEHTELYVSTKEAMEVIPQLPVIYDEPFGDSSAVPTHLVSQLARQNVAVSLSGDGGDELFGGYARYFRSVGHWQKRCLVPLPLRSLSAAVLRSFSTSALDITLQNFAAAIGRPLSKSITAKTALVADLLACEEFMPFYRTMTSQWNDPPVVKLGVDLCYGINDDEQKCIREPIGKMMAADSLTYLPDDILVKVDRAAMAVSLETRVPLLDHRVVELAWQLPYTMKVRNGQGKWLLRQVLYRHVPRTLIERPKMGFGIPVSQWLRGSLRDWAEDLLSESSLEAQSHLNPQPIRERWQQHIKGQHNWKDSLWLVLMWQSWLKENK